MLSADQFYRCKSLRSFSQKYWGFTAVKCFLPSFFFMLDQRVEACKLTIKKCANCHVHCFHISNRTKRYESRYARQIVLFTFSLLLVKYALIAFTPRRTEQKKGHRASPWIQKVNLLTAAFPKILHHVQQQRRVHFAVLDIHARSIFFQGFLFEAQIPVSCVKDYPKKHTRRVQWRQSFTYWPETGQEPALSRKTLGLDRWFKTSTSLKKTNERTDTEHCRHLFDCIGQSQD